MGVEEFKFGDKVRIIDQRKFRQLHKEIDKSINLDKGIFLYTLDQWVVRVGFFSIALKDLGHLDILATDIERTDF